MTMFAAGDLFFTDVLKFSKPDIKNSASMVSISKALQPWSAEGGPW